MTASPKIQRTTVVTVSYKSGGPLPDMLGSLPSGIPTVIVNNAAEDDHDLRALTADRLATSIVSNPENIGFGAACNLGARHAETEFLLFLNPDARLDPGCLETLEKAADAHPTAVAFNPAMTDDHGRPYFKRGSVLLPRDKHLPRGWPSSDRKVNVLSGAALFIRKTAFDAVNGFDQKIFLYHEDDDISLRLMQAGGDLMFIRDARVIHNSGHSTPRGPESAAFKAYNMGWSRVYAARKHALRLAAPRALISAAVQILNPALMVSARKRAKQTAFLRGVWSATFRGAKS